MSSTETWKDIRGFEGIYQASDLGRVRLVINRRNADAGHILSPFLTDGYAYVRLRRDGKARPFRVQRLVKETHDPRPDSADLEVVHDNGCKTDNRLVNLVWCTRADAQARRHAQYCRGEDVTLAKLTPDRVRAIRRLYADGNEQGTIAARFSVDQSTVSRVLSGRTWRHVA
jgi:hypothetical protein